MIANRRREARTRVFEGASVVFNGRQSVLACTVRNWSETGAMVRMQDWIALPDTFEVQIADKADGRRVRQCWRRGDDVGVMFLNPGDDAADTVVSLAEARATRAARNHPC
ncbi:PilZ domain-containing protein [Bosea sp. (in: a-proteobacteria)]|jgi:hypothetical protein|uniref:PilZ domain-containing protein n=1 Tax=Bosea sp. (in: a-proteobacteria) TaxID=1871050 RepID=UPI00356287B8